MRIAILGTRGVPAQYSGFETCVEEVGARLAARGHHVTVYCRRHHVGQASQEYRGMRLVRLPSLNTKHADTLTHTFLSILHVLHEPADVIHLYGVGNALFLLPLRLFGRRTVISVDGLDWQRKKWGRFAGFWLERSAGLAVRFSDRYIVDSEMVADHYRKRFRQEPVYIAYGADVPEAVVGDEALSRFGLQRRGYVLFVGRLVPEKGVHHLVQAFAMLEEEGKAEGMKLVIVGDNPHAPDYVKSLKPAASPNTHFLGYVYGQPYRELLGHAYLYVQPSELEGTSPSLLAAMGYGNGVLVSDIPENREAIGQAGFTFQAGNPAHLRDQLGKLISEPTLVREFGQRARLRVRAVYNWDTIAGQTERLYGSVLAHPSQGGDTLCSDV